MNKQAILTLAVAALICAAPPLHSQPANPSPTPTSTAWNDNAGSQLAQLLASPSTAVQEKGLELALSLSGQTELDLSAAAEPLLSIYQTSDDEAFRLAALAALVRIGDEQAMQVVRRGVGHQPAERVRVATLGALATYYGIGTFSRDAEVAEMASGLRANLAYAPQ